MIKKADLASLFIFGIVGVIGFVVDAGVLYLLAPLLGPVVGRLFSFITAVFVTWLLNRNITFKAGKRQNKLFEFLYYFWCMIFGGLTNLATYYILLHYSQTVFDYPIIGVAAGSIAGMLINFVSSKYLVFK